MPSIGARFCAEWLRALFLISSALLLGSVGVAQTNTAGEPAVQTVRPGRITIDDEARQFAKKLGLSDAQEVAVKKILEQRQMEMLRIRRNPYISGSTRIEQLRASQTTTVERIRGVLTEDQKKKYDPLAVREVPPAPQQRTVDDWLKATMQK